MGVRNADIADQFEALADLLEIDAENPFRIRAYRNAARTIRGHPQRMADLVREGADLSEIPTIGDDLAEKIATIVRTGRLPLLQERAARTPKGLRDLLHIAGLGPKRVAVLQRELGIRNVSDLRRALDQHKVRALKGFGPKSEQTMRDGLARLAHDKGRMKLALAEPIADDIRSYLARCPGVSRVAVAGSFRRRRETVGDLDIVVTASRSAAVMRHLTDYEDVERVLSQGSTRASVRLRGGLQVDVRVVAAASYGAAMIYFTGSKAHNIALRRIAQKRGLKINEYGVYRGDERIAGKTEASVYRALKLAYVEPELRENRGEIERAADGRLPKLVRLTDLRGDLHCHTDASDGTDSLSAMAKAAAKLGYDYLSINDHSQRMRIAHGLDRKRLEAQIGAIDRLNASLRGIAILKSVEVDILRDGSLDLPDAVLCQLDVVVAAIHEGFSLSAQQQTKRMLRAMDNPHVNIIAHPTGRLINARAAYPLDLEAVLEGAKDRGCALELNAHPDRLDLNDEACALAKSLGVKVSLGTDAHSTAGLANMRFGVDQARRGGLEADDIVNTRSLSALRRLLTRR